MLRGSFAREERGEFDGCFEVEENISASRIGIAVLPRLHAARILSEQRLPNSCQRGSEAKRTTEDCKLRIRWRISRKNGFQ